MSDLKKVKKSKRAKTEVAPATLSSFLLAQVEQTDSALNDIFATSKGPALVYEEPKRVKAPKAKKVVLPVAEEESPPELGEDEVLNDADLSEADSNESLELEDDSDNDDGVEEAYAAQQVATRLKALAAGAKIAEPESGDEIEQDEEDLSEEESELDIENLMHESVMPKLKKSKGAEGGSLVPSSAKKAKKIKVVSTDTPEERDARTIFLGNVPVDCSTSRPMKKALIRHILTNPALLALLPANMPPLKASSVRFRSLAFASTVFGRKATVEGAPEEPVAEAGGRGRKRAREWRDTEGTDERGVKGGFKARESVPDKAVPTVVKKGALTDGQKRRVAFIRGELNEGKKACNAYLVVDPLPLSSPLNMIELIKLIVQTSDGSLFETFTLRADHVRPRSSAATLAAAQTLAKPNTALIDPQIGGASYTVPPLEARRTLFVGGMDFAESEENVRAATEAILVKERGVCPTKGWVERVRIIRDASTGLGKGFGYILFKDAECVDEILALPFGQPLKVSKRKVRLERCKTGVAAARAKAAAAVAREVKALPPSTKNLAAPRDPASFMKSAPRMSNSNTESIHQAKLALALAKLPVEERKAVKAVDPDRLARRSEKKKNKVLGERWERKNAATEKNGILGRATRAEERNKKEKKRVAAGNKTGKRAKI